MKDIYSRSDLSSEEHYSDKEYSYHPYLKQSVKDEDDFFPSHSNSMPSCSIIFAPSNPCSDLSIQESKQEEIPCCSHHVAYRPKNRTIDHPHPYFTIDIKEENLEKKIKEEKIVDYNEGDLYKNKTDIKNINFKLESCKDEEAEDSKNRYLHSTKEDIDIKEENLEKKIKEEKIVDPDEIDLFENQVDLKEINHSPFFPGPSSEKFLKEQIIAEFYQKEVSLLINTFFFKPDNSILSQSKYDYKRVQLNKEPKKEMGIEVLNKHLVSFDPFLIINASSYGFSNSSIRRLFQINLRKEINQMRKDMFSHFVQLALQKSTDTDTSYASLKKLILEKLKDISSIVKSRVLYGTPKRDFGRINKGISFIEGELHFCMKTIIREVMRYALFSISIKINGKIKNIFISRVSMAYFLNRYSDCFLEKLINSKKENLFTKKMAGGKYFSWKSLKIKIIKKIINSAQSRFRSLFESDYKDIQDCVFIFEKSGFRPLTKDEFHGLIDFINHLANFEGYSGIVERACRHFYTEEFHKRNPSKIKKNLEYKESRIFLHRVFIKEENGFPKKIFLLDYDPEEKEIKSKSGKIKMEVRKNPRKKNKDRLIFYNRVENFHQIINQLVQNEEKINYPSISQSSFDHRQSLYKMSLSVYKRGEINVTDNKLLYFDPKFFTRSFFDSRPYSTDTDRRKFQDLLRKKIDEEIAETVFMDFIRMSLPNESKTKKENYSSWKQSVSKKIDDLSKIFAEEIFSEDYKKKLKNSKFINGYSYFCTKNLIKEVLRHALFSIPTGKEKNFDCFFLSRATLSLFFNKYTDYILSIFLKKGLFKGLTRSSNFSYASWKRLKSKKISKIIDSSRASFGEILKNDYNRLRNEVLIFKKDGFKEMIDSEFQILVDFIIRLATSNNVGSFIDRSTRYFYFLKKNERN